MVASFLQLSLQHLMWLGEAKNKKRHEMARLHIQKKPPGPPIKLGMTERELSTNS